MSIKCYPCEFGHIKEFDLLNSIINGEYSIFALIVIALHTVPIQEMNIIDGWGDILESIGVLKKSNGCSASI